MFLIFFHNACERILSDVCKNKITMSFQKNLFTWRFKKISAWCSKKLFCWCCYVLKKILGDDVMLFGKKIMMWRFSFLKGGVKDFFQIHSKGIYKHPSDSRNHPEWLFWSCETCLRHIRNHPITENYFLRLHFRKLPSENE